MQCFRFFTADFEDKIQLCKTITLSHCCTNWIPTWDSVENIKVVANTAYHLNVNLSTLTTSAVYHITYRKAWSSSQAEPGKAITLHQQLHRLPPFPVQHPEDTTVHAGQRIMVCTWFGEMCSCSCLTALPSSAWVLLGQIYPSRYVLPKLYLMQAGCLSPAPFLLVFA